MKCLSSACKPLLTVIGSLASVWGATLQVLNAILKRFEPVLILADCIQVSDFTEMYAVYAELPCVPGYAHCSVALLGISQSCVMPQGIVISCCLICAVLFCSAAWDYILQYWTAFAPHVMPPADRNLLPPGTEPVCTLYMS